MLRTARSACTRACAALEARVLHTSSAHAASGRGAYLLLSLRIRTLTRARAGAAAAAAQRAAQEDGRDPLLFQAQLREEGGRIPAAKLRKLGRTPAVVFNQFDEEKVLVSLDERDLMRKLVAFRKSGFLSRVFTLELPAVEAGAPAVRVPVLPKQIYVDGATERVENVSFLRCPPDARVKVEVPLLVSGLDASPGLRKGGTVNLMRRKVLVWCAGSGVPASVPLDLSSLDVGAKLLLRDLPLPEGVQLAGRDSALPVVKIMGRVERNAEEGEEGGTAAPPAQTQAKAAPAPAGKAPAAAPAGAAAKAPAAGKPPSK